MEVSGILPHLLAVILLIIGLLTGVLSVAREIQQMYWPAAAQSRKVFWGWVRVAFVFALVILWFDEHSKVVTGPIPAIVISPSVPAIVQAPANPGPAGPKLSLMYEGKLLDRQRIFVSVDAQTQRATTGHFLIKNEGTPTTAAMTLRLCFSQDVTVLNAAPPFGGPWQEIECDEKGAPFALAWVFPLGSSVSTNETWTTPELIMTGEKFVSEAKWNTRVKAKLFYGATEPITATFTIEKR